MTALSPFPAQVHYMQDRERGVVWEECIVFTPPGARCVFLSATLPNALQFASWVSSLHSAPCHVVYTDSRPTPLQHFVFPAGGDGLFLVVDETGRFREDTFAKVRDALSLKSGDAPGSGGGGGRGGGGRGRGGRGGGRGGIGGGGAGGGGGDGASEAEAKATHVYKLVKLCRSKAWTPVIVFSFSRKECETYATTTRRLGDKFDFTTPAEKGAIQEVFDAAVGAVLGAAERELPPVACALSLLLRGVGLHHSGLLPVVKELTELLFQDGFIKVLFTTETFAMGLNMPARTVIFTSTSKFDGQANRAITPGEYTQMSGRAGRRGKDDKGICIVIAEPDFDEAAARTLLTGATAPLNSSFKLSYYTLLNVLRRSSGEVDMEKVIARSFHQFQHLAALPQHKKQLAALETAAEAVAGAGPASASAFEAMKAQLADAHAAVMAEVLRPERSLRFLRPGRIVRVRAAGTDYGWGVVCAVLHSPPKGEAPSSATACYTVDALLRVHPQSGGGGRPVAVSSGAAPASSELAVLPVPLACLTALSSLCLQLPADLRPPEARSAVGLALDELARRFPTGLPRLHPIDDMGIDPQAAPGYAEAAARVALLEPAVVGHPLFATSAAAGAAGEQAAAEAAAHRAALKLQADAIKARMRDDDEVVKARGEDAAPRFLRRRALR